MTDVFGEVAKSIDGVQDDRLSKINGILAGLKGKQEVVVQPTVEELQQPQQTEQTTLAGEKGIDKSSDVVYNPNNGDTERLQEELSEAVETIGGLMEELKGMDELENELARSKIRIRELESQIEYLSGRTKDYMEKVNAIEYDASRVQVPTELMSLVRYYRDSQGDSEYAKENKKMLESDIIRLTEKITGKPLNSYVSDIRAFGSEPIEGNFSSYELTKQKQEDKSKPNTDFIGSIF